MATTTVPTKPLEFTTLVKIDSFTGDIAELALAVEEHLVRIIADEAPATALEYFVRPSIESVQIGLRFRGLPTDAVESVAPEISKDAVMAALAAFGMPNADAHVWSTLLVGA